MSEKSKPLSAMGRQELIEEIEHLRNMSRKLITQENRNTVVLGVLIAALLGEELGVDAAEKLLRTLTGDRDAAVAEAIATMPRGIKNEEDTDSKPPVA